MLVALGIGGGSAGARRTETANPAARAPASVSQAAAESASVDRAQYPSTYRRHPNPPVLIRNATVMTAAGQEIRNGSIVLQDGRIVAVGEKVDAPAGAVEEVGTGENVTPGLVAVPMQLGVNAAPRPGD